MSSTLDANILVYASNEADAVHRPARDLVERLAAGPEIVYLFWPTLLGYLRLVTHPAILPRPLSPVVVMDNVESLLERAHVRIGGELEGFWQRFRDTAGTTVRGRDVPDAHLATLMRQYDVRRIYTRDQGFRRFEGIEVVDPFL